jgi:methylmalonyl-CoA/ethylmalonyl-CoA epimerase
MWDLTASLNAGPVQTNAMNDNVPTTPAAPDRSLAAPEGHPADPTGIGLLRIDHVGVAVADLDAAVDFYTRTFGMRCVHRETNEEQGVREAMMAVGGSAEAGCVQLLAPLSESSTIAKFLDRVGPGVQQVAYTVADLEVASAALRARGLRLLYDRPRRGTAGSRVNFVHPKDAGGVLVELVEPAATTPAGGG